MNVFYCIFAQSIQFPVLDFGLDHYASQPFIQFSEEFPTVLRSCVTNVIHSTPHGPAVYLHLPKPEDTYSNT